MVERAMKGLFQIGYVSSDLDHGLSILKRQLDISEFLIIEDIEVPQNGGRDSLQMSLALSYIGDMMYELIVPRGGDDQIYRGALTKQNVDFTFHHFGMIVDDRRVYDHYLQEHSASGNEIAFEGRAAEHSAFFYTRLADAGHCLEYLWLHEADKHFFDAVPRLKPE